MFLLIKLTKIMTSRRLHASSSPLRLLYEFHNKLGQKCDLQGIQCDSIHGDREQSDREQAITDFKSGYIKLLIATDVASRGLDIKDITCVRGYLLIPFSESRIRSDVAMEREKDCQ